MTEKWKKTIDEGLTKAILLKDFRKDFDCINNVFLNKKLIGCRISGSMFDNLRDYLNNQSHYVEFNGTKSR